MRLLASIPALALAWSLSVASALAQFPLAPAAPPPSYNAQRAYRHFLNSPYSFRTYSGSYPGFTTGSFTPHGYAEYSQGPGYVHEEITPRGSRFYHLNTGGHGVFIPYRPRPLVRVDPYFGPLLP